MSACAFCGTGLDVKMRIVRDRSARRAVGTSTPAYSAASSTGARTNMCRRAETRNGDRPERRNFLRLLRPKPRGRQKRFGAGPRQSARSKLDSLQDQGARFPNEAQRARLRTSPRRREIGCGGLLLKMKDLGYATGIIDMTGATWAGHARAAGCRVRGGAKILKLTCGPSLDLGDTRIEDTTTTGASWRRRPNVPPEMTSRPTTTCRSGAGWGTTITSRPGSSFAGVQPAHLRKAPIEGEPFRPRPSYYFIPPGTRPTSR